MKTIALVLMVSLLAMAAPHAAEARTIGVGAHVGYSKAEDADDGTYHIGGDLSLRPIDLVGLMLEVEYRKDDVDVDGTGGVIKDAEIEYIPILLSAQVFPFGDSLGAFSPFLIGGGGWYITRSEIRGSVAGIDGRFTDYDSSTGWHFGFGTDVNLGPFLTLTGDFRYVFLETNLEDVDDSDADGIRLTFGAKFFL